MENRVTILGVHPVNPPGVTEPVHVVEIAVEGDIRDFPFINVTQELPDMPRGEWLTTWGEVVYVESAGAWESVWSTRYAWEAANQARFAFFFHRLDLAKPLLTPFGVQELPPETPLPAHLRGLEYEVP